MLPVLLGGLYFASLSDGIDQSEEIVVFNLLFCHTKSGIFTRCHIKKLAGEPAVSPSLPASPYLIKNNTTIKSQSEL